MSIGYSAFMSKGWLEQQKKTEDISVRWEGKNKLNDVFLPRSLEGKLLVSLTLFPKQSLMRTTRCLLINIPFFKHQVLHQDRPRLIQGRKQGDEITFKLDCLKCDQSYTFEVWAVDKEDHM